MSWLVLSRGDFLRGVGVCFSLGFYFAVRLHSPTRIVFAIFLGTIRRWSKTLTMILCSE